MKVLALVVVLGLFASIALAGEDELSRAYECCMAESDGGDFLMVDCIQQELERQDARLNVAYEENERYSIKARS